MRKFVRETFTAEQRRECPDILVMIGERADHRQNPTVTNYTRMLVKSRRPNKPD
jgi:hypothetical protein